MTAVTGDDDWQPSASIEALRERARLLATIRAFFAARNVLEVETPILGHGGSTDPHLDSLSLEATTPDGCERLWLQTSPEFHMKRLLAAGSGPIFQLARSFRDGEVGRRHNIEFTMLEWYRPGFSLDRLIAECEALIREVLPTDPGPLRQRRYRDLFREHFELDPFQSSLADLRRCAGDVGGLSMSDADRDGCLDLLMSLAIEPRLGGGGIDVIVDYPASQAALARKHIDSEDSVEVAARFEIYLQGLELANGYDELTDASEQHLRLLDDNRQRGSLGKSPVDIDSRLIAALEHGMPAASGVALGVDRLIQLALAKSAIAEVMAFPTSRC